MNSLQTKLFWSAFLAGGLAVCLITALLGRIAIGKIEAQLDGELLSSAQMAAAVWEPTSTFSHIPSAVRLTLVSPDGTVLSDSSGQDEKAFDNHLDRPEFTQILKLGLPQGRDQRYSETLGEQMRYLALPVRDAQGRLRALCRAARSTEAMRQETGRVASQMSLVALAALALCALTAHLVATRVTRAVTGFTRTVEAIANGDTAARVALPRSPEAERLSEAFAALLDAFRSRERALTLERESLRRVLEGMREAVAFLGPDGRVRLANPAARRLLGAAAEEGADLPALLRVPALNDLLEEAAKEGSSAPERDLVLPQREGERSFLATASTLSGKGTVLVLTDVTRLRRLETIRKEFTANVSHELRTPVTAILGFTETLLDGALDDPQHARRFLNIIHAHTYRLLALIKDLLALTRLERENETASAEPPREIPLKELLAETADALRTRAAERHIAIETDCPEGLLAWGWPDLLRQAVGNLLENAVAYSPENGVVRLDAWRDGPETCIRVSDHGCGIPQEYHERIFERFFTVDKARSRASGGTGLGLAIVKHIAERHRGRVTLESEPGKGSAFTLRLPSAPAAGLDS